MYISLCSYIKCLIIVTLQNSDQIAYKTQGKTNFQ